MSPTRLVIVQRRLTHYRVPFFTALRDHLGKRDVTLTLVVGQPNQGEFSKHDEGSLPWAVFVPTYYWLGGKLCWMDVRSPLAQQDLVVLTQENRMLNNLPLLLLPQRQRMALWGHGRNFQSIHKGCTAEDLKRTISRRADWWFAYTDLSAKVVRDFGYDGHRITVLNNAVDTNKLRQRVAEAKSRPRAELMRELGLSAAGPLALFMGSLYEEKRLDILVDAAALIRQQLPDFRLIILGDGTMRPWLERAVADMPWVHVMGVKRGWEKNAALAAADVVLNPGLIGLGILDAFAAGLPVVTTDCGLHSPEICYLQPDVNGVMTVPYASHFAAAVVGLLTDDARRLRMADAALRSADRYNLQSMVQRFADGVDRWRTSSPRRG